MIDTLTNRQVRNDATSTPGARPRLTNAQKVAKHRERKARGVVAVVPVEIAETVLPMLAAGAQLDVQALREDRQLLATTAARALKHLSRFFTEHGHLPQVQPKTPVGT